MASTARRVPTMLSFRQPFDDEEMFLRQGNRLPATVYRSPGSFSFTLCTAGRRPHLRVRETVTHLQSILLDKARACRVEIDAYCFMPDHLHLLVSSDGAGVRTFIARFKQASAYWFRQSRCEDLWQKGYYDHVLGSDEAIERVVAYILDNPVRAGLCRNWEEYPYSWSRFPIS